MSDKPTQNTDKENLDEALNSAEQVPEENLDTNLDTEGEPDTSTAETQDNSALSLDEALSQLDEAQQKLLAQRDEVLRVQAEMQNLRRRTEQDIERAHKYGLERFASELLPVLDNLERALQVGDATEDGPFKALHEGVELTLKSFLACLKKFNIEVLDPLGEPFDPQLHQAMSIQESAEAEPDTVIAVMQKGYTLHGRVIRPAMVMVSRAPAPEIDEKA